MRASLCLVLVGLMLLSILVNITNSERICFSCSGITQDEKCQHAISCDKDEICFVQKYYTHGIETKYDVGCTFQEMCQMDVAGHIIGKRNDHAHILCQKCCNDANVCNHDLSCQNTKLVVAQKCLSCDNVDNPKSCNSSMTCAKDEVCFLHKYMTETQQVKYDLGCKHSMLCFHGLNIFGRRSSAGRHLTCDKCCGGTNHCNVDLQCGHQEQGTTLEATTVGQTTTVDPRFSECKGPITKNTGEFYLMRNNGFLSFMSTFKLHLSSSKVKWLVIYNPDIGLCHNISIFNTSQVIDIPSEFKVTRNEIEKKGVHILTSSKTDLYALYKDSITNEGFFVLPKEKLSTSYVIPSFIPSGGGESFIGIVATSVDTDVNITLKLLDKTETVSYNNTKYGDGETISIHLAERGTLELSSNTELTGTIVQSNKDIGVQSGVDGAKVPVNSGLMNLLLEMLPPVKELGTTFFIPPLFDSKRFILRLIATHPNTSITLLGKQLKQATKVVDKIGGYIDINSNASIKVESDKPVMAVYYQQGDFKPVVPFMVIIEPEEKLEGVQEFTIPNDGLRHHILITTKSNEYPFLHIDGKGIIYKNLHTYDTESLNSSYVVSRVDIGPGHHTIGSLYPMVIKVKPGIIIFADSDNDIAYGYPV